MVGKKTIDIKVQDNFDVVFRLAVYKTRKEMLSAINRDVKDEKTGSNCMGMFRPTVHIIDGRIPGIGYSNIFGTMYLNLADLNGEIITHECAHAAFAWEFYVRHYTGPFDDDGFDEQEQFCYWLGLAVEKVKKAVKQNFGGKKR